MAGHIPEDKISEIRKAADIVEVISDVVLLKKAGRNYIGLCPFHSEKTPSFTVSPEKQIFHCFGCGTGGNVFTFLMKQEGLSFPEAARALARRCGITIAEKEMSFEQEGRISEKEELVKINRAAMSFFHNLLLKSPEGEKGLSYLQKRRISKETIECFQLGYAPPKWDSLTTFFQKKKIPLTRVEKSGLIIQRGNKNGYYDRFRDRILFPIFDLRDQVVGFGGRVLDDSLPKYLNSPDSPLFNKGRTLYGLNLSRSDCRQIGSVYIVEGYFDVLALHQHGIKNAVATLGTAFTADHLRAIKGYAGRLNLVFDSDEAGIKSAERSIAMFIESNSDARIIVLPEGYDPDTFLFEFGADAFLKISGRALGLLTFLIHASIKKHGLTIEGKMRIVSDLNGFLGTIHDPVVRSLCIKEISERIDVDESAILEKVREISSKPSAAKNPGGYRKSALDTSFESEFRKTNDAAVPGGKENRLEKQIVAMMVQFPEILPEIRKRHLLDGFENGKLKAIGELVLELCDNACQGVSDMLAFARCDEQREMIVQLAIQEDVWDLNGCFRLISQYELSRSRRENSLLEKIRTAEKDGDDDLLLELLRKKQEIAKKRY